MYTHTHAHARVCVYAFHFHYSINIFYMIAIPQLRLSFCPAVSRRVAHIATSNCTLHPTSASVVQESALQAHNPYHRNPSSSQPLLSNSLFPQPLSSALSLLKPLLSFQTTPLPHNPFCQHKPVICRNLVSTSRHFPPKPLSAQPSPRPPPASSSPTLHSHQ